MMIDHVHNIVCVSCEQIKKNMRSNQLTVLLIVTDRVHDTHVCLKWLGLEMNAVRSTEL